MCKAFRLGLPCGKRAAGDDVVLKAASGVGFVDADEVVLVGEWQRLQQDGMDNGEQRYIRADAEAHDENCEDGEARGAGEGAHAVAKIAKQNFEPAPAPCLARLIAQVRRIAEGAKSCAAGLFRIHAGGEIFGDLQFEMKLEFIMQLISSPVAEKERLDTHQQFVGGLAGIDHRVQPSCTTRLMASERRLQLAVSDSSCLRPAAVRE